MKTIAFVITVLGILAFASAQAEAILGEEGAKKSSDGKIVYPKEIENCEPCKRLWLANNQKHAKNNVAKEGTSNNTKKAGQTIKVGN